MAAGFFLPPAAPPTRYWTLFADDLYAADLRLLSLHTPLLLLAAPRLIYARLDGAAGGDGLP